MFCSPFNRYRYDLLFQQNINSLQKRPQSSSNPPPPSSDTSQTVSPDKNVSVIKQALKGLNIDIKLSRQSIDFSSNT